MKGSRKLVCLVVFISICRNSWASNFLANELTEKFQFPEKLMIGLNSEAFRLKEAVNKSGGNEGSRYHPALYNIRPTLNGTNVDSKSNGYQKFQKEIEQIKSLGFSLYIFSLSWPWILPNGTTEWINENSVNYYKELVTELCANNIQPMVILYERDMPQQFLKIGGWLNATVVEHFEQYARLVFQHLGPKVKWWITINKPTDTVEGYGSWKTPPALNLHGYGEYLAGHNLLRAHARVYRMYQKEFATGQRGKISIGLKGDFVFPAADSEEAERAAETALQFSVGWFGHPVYSTAGDYPVVMRDYIDRNSAIEELKQSRLPYFSREEIQQIRGSFDFLAVSHSTSFVAAFSQVGPRPSWRRDSGVKMFFKENWPSSNCSTIKIVPEGVRRILNWFREDYRNIETFITVNDFCDNVQQQGNKRAEYHREYLSEIMKAVNEDNCTVIGYSVSTYIHQ